MTEPERHTQRVIATDEVAGVQRERVITPEHHTGLMYQMAIFLLTGHSPERWDGALSSPKEQHDGD